MLSKDWAIFADNSLSKQLHYLRLYLMFTYRLILVDVEVEVLLGLIFTPYEKYSVCPGGLDHIVLTT